MVMERDEDDKTSTSTYNQNTERIQTLEQEMMLLKKDKFEITEENHQL
jgi:hypothetical protein